MNHQNFERTLRFRVIPGSMLVGVSAHQPSPHKKGHSLAWSGGLWASTARACTQVFCVCGRPSKCRLALFLSSALSRLSQIAPLSRAGVVTEDRLEPCVLPRFMPSSANDERFDEKQNPPEKKKSSSEKNPAFFSRFQSEKGKKKIRGRIEKNSSVYAPSPTRLSNQARRPAEFKHIIKRRKRN